MKKFRKSPNENKGIKLQDAVASVQVSLSSGKTALKSNVVLDCPGKKNAAIFQNVINKKHHPELSQSSI